MDPCLVIHLLPIPESNLLYWGLDAWTHSIFLPMLLFGPFDICYMIHTIVFCLFLSSFSFRYTFTILSRLLDIYIHVYILFIIFWLAEFKSSRWFWIWWWAEKSTPIWGKDHTDFQLSNLWFPILHFYIWVCMFADHMDITWWYMLCLHVPKPSLWQIVYKGQA